MGWSMAFGSKRNFLTGLLVLLLAGASAWGQTGTTSLRGVVTDQSGAVISGAKVTLANALTGLHRETETSNAGEYEFLSLAPGAYSLTVDNSKAGDYGLRIGLAWWIVGMILVAAYHYHVYRSFAGKVKIEEAERGY